MEFLGKPEEAKWVGNFECKECKAPLKVTEDDLMVHDVPDGSDNSGDFSIAYTKPEVYFCCIRCKSENKAKIPSGIQSSLFEKYRATKKRKN